MSISFKPAMSGRVPVEVVVEGTPENIAQSVLEAERLAADKGCTVSWHLKRVGEWRGIARPKKRPGMRKLLKHFGR